MGVMLVSILISAEMNKNNDVIEKINVGLHSKVFREECQKANKNLQGLIEPLHLRLVSLFCSVCQCCLLALIFLIVSTQWQLNVLQRITSLVCVCLKVHSWFQYFRAIIFNMLPVSLIDDTTVCKMCLFPTGFL